ncbi:hypothetical protein NQZ68_002750 [Dissostichus eleginoides]|nr:hypothetical protein NQZ68_002750 [Dissostichus eleginoides]
MVHSGSLGNMKTNEELAGTGGRKESGVSLDWGYQEIQEPRGHQAPLGPLLRALLALRGPVDPLGTVTQVTAYFHPCEPSGADWKTNVKLRTYN